MTEMKKSFVHLLTSAVVIQTLMGSSPLGTVATVAVESPDIVERVAIGSARSFYQRLISRWHKTETEMSEKPHDKTLKVPKEN